MSITEGFQFPEIPFGEVVFKIGAVVPLQSDSDVAKFGTMEAFTVTTKVAVEAHCPGFGVKT